MSTFRSASENGIESIHFYWPADFTGTGNNCTEDQFVSIVKVDGQLRVSRYRITDMSKNIPSITLAADPGDSATRSALYDQHSMALADAVPQIVWTAKPDGALDYYNQHWIDYTGMSIEETAGWGWAPVLHPDDLQCIDVWTNSYTTGEPYEIEYRFKRASDGSYRWHLGRALPVRDQAGTIIKWFGTCTDIHEQKQALNDVENKVRERTSELASVNENLLAEIE